MVLTGCPKAMRHTLSFILLYGSFYDAVVLAQTSTITTETVYTTVRSTKVVTIGSNGCPKLRLPLCNQVTWGRMNGGGGGGGTATGTSGVLPGSSVSVSTNSGSSTITSDGTETGGTATRTGASTETGTNTGTGGATTTNTTTNGSNTTRLTTSTTGASRSTSLGSSSSSTNATTAVPLPLESGSSPVFVMGGSIGGGVDEAYAIYAANSPLVLMSGDAAGERAYFSVLPNTTMVDALNTSRIIYLHFIPAHARIGKRQSNQGIYAMQYGHISDFMKRDTPDILSGYNLDPEKGVSCTGPDGKELSVVLAGGDSEGKGVGMALPDADYGTISVSSFVQQVATVSVAVNPDGGFSISQAPLSTPAAVAASVASASSASVASVASVSSASIASVASASSASASSASVASVSSRSSSSSTTTRATGPDAYDIITSNSLQAYCYTLLAYIPKATTVTTEGTTTLPQYTKSTTVSRTAATPGGDSTVKYTALSATTTVFSDLPRRRRARRSKSGETYTKNPDPTIITKRQNNAPTALSNYATSQLSSACSRAITSPTSVRTLTATTYVTSYTPATGVSTIFTTVATTTSVFLISTPVSTIPISTYLPGSSYLKVGGTSAWRNYYLGKLAAVDSYGSVARGWASTDVTSASRFSFLYSKNTGEYRLSMTDTTTSPATDLQLWTNLTNSQVYLLDGDQQSNSFFIAAWATWTVKMKTGYYTLQPSGSKNVIGACFDNSSNFLRFFLFATPNSGEPDFQGGNTQWTGCVTIPYFVLCRTCHVNGDGDILDGESRRMFD